MGLFDLEGALGFYGSYHNNKMNQVCAFARNPSSLIVPPLHCTPCAARPCSQLPASVSLSPYLCLSQLIHVIFVPCIVWSFMVVINYLSLDMVLGHHVYLFGAKVNDPPHNQPATAPLPPASSRAL